MAAAASRLHGKIHAKALNFFINNFPEDIEWSIDEDLETDEGKIHYRPDIIGRDAEDNIILAAEIAVTSLVKDMKVAKSYCEMLKINDYFVVDCNKQEIHHFVLDQNSYQYIKKGELDQKMEKFLWG